MGGFIQKSGKGGLRGVSSIQAKAGWTGWKGHGNVLIKSGSSCAAPTAVIAATRLYVDVTFCDTVASASKSDWEYRVDGGAWTSFAALPAIDVTDNVVKITHSEAIAAGTVEVQYTPGTMTVGGDSQEAIVITCTEA